MDLIDGPLLAARLSVLKPGAKQELLGLSRTDTNWFESNVKVTVLSVFRTSEIPHGKKTVNQIHSNLTSSQS